MLLATVGIYALLSYVVAQRNKEIAVRLALGASGRNVITDVWRRKAEVREAVENIKEEKYQRALKVMQLGREDLP